MRRGCQPIEVSLGAGAVEEGLKGMLRRKWKTGRDDDRV